MQAYGEMERQIDRWIEFLKDKDLQLTDYELIKLAIELTKLDTELKHF
jgi:hypothetical protein